MLVQSEQSTRFLSQDNGQYHELVAYAVSSTVGWSHGVMVSTPDSGSQGHEFESQWKPYQAVKYLSAIRSRQISDAQ
ncbi:hypothetical protein WISP_84883 [Willisornis vidua]|uniref:Uncharacterized protein n=1 Tax=Willisornis vidua TaxID=1566151 RepID=A0ABQ9D675_9PASS|nr:hypothetical protein WISP_84883 [Willisornis vidua]